MKNIERIMANGERSFKEVKVFSESHKAVKELSKLKEDTKASTEKRAIES